MLLFYETPLVFRFLGELDMLPISHAAILHGQHAALPPAQRASKAVVIVPGMDHSQFCSPCRAGVSIARWGAAGASSE